MKQEYKQQIKQALRLGLIYRFYCWIRKKKLPKQPERNFIEWFVWSVKQDFKTFTLPFRMFIDKLYLKQNKEAMDYLGEEVGLPLTK